jgi:hypothetical protein
VGDLRAFPNNEIHNVRKIKYFLVHLIVDVMAAGYVLIIFWRSNLLIIGGNVSSVGFLIQSLLVAERRFNDDGERSLPLGTCGEPSVFYRHEAGIHDY